MKNIIKITAILFALAAWIFCAVSCQDDAGTADPQIEISTESISLSRTGLDYQGQFPYVEVTSNIYWTATISAQPEIGEGDPWIVMSDMGGHGTTEVDITVTENTTSEVRKATITFDTQSGVSRQLVVTQAQGDEIVVMYSDDFGTGTSGVDVNDYDDFGYYGQGVEAPSGVQFGYEGIEASVSSSNQSNNSGASGGNNILLAGGGSQLVLKNIRSVYQTDFLISFNSMTTGQAFDTGEFLLEISTDGEQWYDIPYYRSAEAGWAQAQYDLSLAEAYTYLYLRFVNNSAEDYHIDDVSIVLNIPSDNIYQLEQPSISLEAASLPLYWYLYGETMVHHGLTFSHERESYYVLSESSDKYYGGVGRLSYETNGRDLETAPNFDALIGGTGQPYVVGVLTDDYWMWSVPLEELTPGDYVYIKFPTRVSAAGMKYWTLEMYDGGIWKTAGELQSATESPDILYTHAMNSDGSTNIIVEEYLPVTTGFAEDTLRVRFRCAGMVRAGNGAIAPSPTAGTARIAGDENDRPVISVLPASEAPDEPQIEVSGLTYNSLTFDGTATYAKSFSVKANYLWTLETEDLEWADVTPTFGGKDQTVKVAVTPTYNDRSMRVGSIIINCMDKHYAVTVVQSAAGSGGDIYGLPQTVDCNSLSNTNEQGLSWLNNWTLLASGDGESYITWTKGPGNPSGGTQDISASQPRTEWASDGDYWLWTIPVANGPQNNKVKISGGVRSSAKGPRHLILEWSIDGNNWTEVDVVDDVVTITPDSGTPYPVNVRYTDVFDITGTTGQTFTKEFVISDEVGDGFYYVRARVSGSVAQDLTRENGTNTGGTHRITDQWVIEQVAE